ncbi:MAG TPA: DegT/DnrJ/EryC1/StrS family aminotransferase [Verrucomicrobiae bacterium]|nr:DegT/DnrJ/EryC1/StrS family aminotransferase [Verrucomicrobiae bacterium]
MADLLPLVDLNAQYRSIAHEILPAVTNVFESAAFIMGPDLDAFEMEFANFVGTQYCIGVESGTAALKVALQAIGVGPGDEVIIPANTYIACAFAVSQVGAIPIMVDVDDAYLMDADSIEAAITSKTKAIMPVHLYGQAVDIDRILALAKTNGIKVIEDVSQAHGAMHRGKRAGSFGDVAAFSFYPSKNLGAYGDGGAIVTNDPEIADRVRLLRDFGQRKKYEHWIIGDNCRLDTVQAAVLRVKLRHLDAWNAQRQRAARLYDERIREIGLQPPISTNRDGHVYHLYVVALPERDRAIASLAEKNIETGVHYPIPIHLQPAYEHLGIERGRFPKTEAAASVILSLPMFPEITEQQIDRVTNVLQAHVDAISSRLP